MDGISGAECDSSVMTRSSEVGNCCIGGRKMMAQNNGVCFSMDFCCNNEEKEMRYEWQVSERPSKRLEMLLMVGYFCLTISHTRSNIVECTVCFVVHDA